MITKVEQAFKVNGRVFETHEEAQVAEVAGWIEGRGGYTEFQAINMAKFFIKNQTVLNQIISQGAL